MMNEKPMEYTEDELITRLWDTEYIRHTMNRFCYYLSNEEARRAINELWVTKPENRQSASLGVNTGYYAGLGEVVRHLVLDRDRRLYQNLEARHAADASVENANSWLGYGCSRMCTLTTPLIVIADDGRSARFLGISPGFMSEGKPYGMVDAYITFDLIVADLLKEDGEWRIWHLTFAHDHTVECGTNYANVPIFDWDDPVTMRDGEPTVKRDVYNPLYGWEHIYDDMPRNYYTYTERDGYGPDSDFGKPYYGRRRHW